MPRLPIEIRRGDHPPSIQVGHPVEAVRFLSQISLASLTGLTAYRRVILDSGAPISLLPSTYWRAAAYVPFGRTQVGGIAARAECRIPATLSEIHCTLSDGAAVIGPLKMYAYLAETDSAPALLGVSGFIRSGILHIGVDAAEAYLEMP